MIKSTLRNLAVATLLAGAGAQAPTLAGEAPAAAPAKPYVIPPKTPDYIKQAIESPKRVPEQVARDFYRKPADVLRLSGVRKGNKVVELGPYGWYYSELLSEVIGPKGELHMFDQAFVGEVYGEAGKKFAETHPNAKYQAVDFDKIELPRNVDVIFNILTFHEMLLIGVDMERFHTAVFKALKPGGVYLVIDHAATHGKETNDLVSLRRIDPGLVRPYVTIGGLQLDEDSRILENLQDDHSWSAAADEGRSDETDKIVYKFVKPVVY
jgi:predicted methyltransferase